MNLQELSNDILSILCITEEEALNICSKDLELIDELISLKLKEYKMDDSKVSVWFHLRQPILKGETMVNFILNDKTHEALTLLKKENTFPGGLLLIEKKVSDIQIVEVNN